MNATIEQTTLFDPQITYCQSVSSGGKQIALSDAINAVRNGFYHDAIERLPDPSDKNAYRSAKSALPVWSFNGVFSAGIPKNNTLTISSDLFHFDIDHLDSEQLEQHRAMLITHSSLVFLFVSPSKKGLKGAMRLPHGLVKSDDDFKKVFAFFENYFAEHGITIDESCKDVRRFCFVSSDPLAYLNQRATPMVIDLPQQSIPTQKATPQQSIPTPPQHKPTSQQPRFNPSEHALNNVRNILLAASKGNYHRTRLKAGRLAGGYVAGGMLDMVTAYNALDAINRTIHAQCGDDESTQRNAAKAILDGIAYGQRDPIQDTHTDIEIYLAKPFLDSILKTKAFSAETQKILDEINGKTTYQPTPEPVLNDVFPVKIANQLAGFINAMSNGYSTTATNQAVISLLALLAARRYTTPTGDSCQIYAGISSSSVGSIGELRYASRGVRAILQACGLRRMVREGRLTSSQALFKMLYFSPASLYLCDDYSAMLKLCNRQTTGGMEVVINAITRLYDERVVQLDSPQDADLRITDLNSEADGKPLIYRPSLSMLTLMHPSQLATFAKISEVGRGSVEQFLFARCENDDYVMKDEAEIQIPEDVIDHLLTIRGISNKPGTDGFTFGDIFSDILSECSSVQPVLFAVRYDVPIDEFYKRIDAVTTDHRRYRSFLNAARRNLNRLITIMAAANNPLQPVATREIMAWCADYVAHHLTSMIDILEVSVSDDGKVDIGQSVLEVIIRHGAEGVEAWRLVTLCRPYKAMSKEKRQELINKMLDDGDIKHVSFKMPSGQLKKRIIHSKYDSKNLVGIV